MRNSPGNLLCTSSIHCYLRAYRSNALCLREPAEGDTKQPLRGAIHLIFAPDSQFVGYRHGSKSALACLKTRAIFHARQDPFSKVKTAARKVQREPMAHQANYYPFLYRRSKHNPTVKPELLPEFAEPCTTAAAAATPSDKRTTPLCKSPKPSTARVALRALVVEGRQG